MITIDQQFDVNKLTAEFLDKNVERLAKSGYEIFKGAKNKIKSNLRKTYSNYLNKIALRYTRTKSFFYRNEPVYIENFYEPLSVSFNNKSLGKATVKKIIGKNNYIVLEGSAGCGKSILMKFLLLDTLKNTSYVPVFIELRDINNRDIELTDLFEEVLKENDLLFDAGYFSKAFEHGHFIFFLDGFDEIEISERNNVAKQLNKFLKKYSNCKVIISSRPDTEFGGWENFAIIWVNSLKVDEACNMIEQLPYDDAIRNKFVKDLKAGLFAKHKSFLSNPLLLSIMLLTYSQSSNIPNKLNVFYNQAYEALYQRHDTLKNGFERKRFTNLDIQDYAKLFSAFCVQSYDKGILQFSRTAAISILDKSKEIVNIDCNSENYLKDSLQSNCLLIEDGLFIVFSHRSFQEYFTAKFIIDSNSNTQKTLLNKFSKNIISDSVFKLLYEMSPRILETQFILPKLEELFGKIGLKSKVGITHFTRYLQLCYTDFGIINNELRAFLKPTGRYSPIMSFLLKHYGLLINWQGFSKGENGLNFEKKYKKALSKKILTSKLTYRSEFVKDLYESGMFFSKVTLVNALKIKKLIETKRRESETSIEEILLKN